MNHNDHGESDLPGWAKKLGVYPEITRTELYMRLALALVGLSSVLLSIATMLRLLSGPFP